jgi:hypothetical protein
MTVSLLATSRGNSNGWRRSPLANRWQKSGGEVAMQDFEKLGVFYLGKRYDLDKGQMVDELLLYDSRDLVTHALCVGMTGSGKTGLGISLLEEAAIDGIPAIIIDPKGDMSNLLLTFPDLRPADFQPWVNPDDARKKGLSIEVYAEQQAAFWKQGLESWGESGERIRKLRQAAEFGVYTPASSAGLPVSILSSFAVPPQAILDDGEMLQDRIATTVSSLLGLMGIEADPIKSREHILLSTLLGQAWTHGKNLDLPALIEGVQNPPVDRIGVLKVEDFFPAKDRFELVIALNNLLAAPGFAAWLEGEPLDIGRMLSTPSGKPRHVIFSIAHLNDAERMFFVSLLLNQLLGWMRMQSGTTSLRAVLYMDEIFGFFPPVANPPSKSPLLSLLKQGRAFGLGLVLATQNPVDLDYKGLSNIGTWFIGRLQTERDRARLMDGLLALESGKALNRDQLGHQLNALGNRIFLMNNVHEDVAVAFQSRWAMSYLRGPMTRDQIKMLMADQVRGVASAAQPAAPAASEVAAESSDSARPALSPQVPQFFIPPGGVSPAGVQVIYQPYLLGVGRIHYESKTAQVDEQSAVVARFPLKDAAVPVDWQAGETVDLDPNDLERSGVEGASYAALPPAATEAGNYQHWEKDFKTWLYGSQRLQLWRSPQSKLLSAPGEGEGEFRARLALASRESRDQAVEKLRAKYGPKVAALQERVRRAQQAVERESSQAKTQQVQTAISFGATLLGAVVGRKAISATTLGRATTAARGVGRAAKEKEDIERAEQSLEAVKAQLAALESEFAQETAELEGRMDPTVEALEQVEIKPTKAAISIDTMVLAWAPYWRDQKGQFTPAWR